MDALLDLTFLIPGLPLLGAVLIAVFGRKLGDPWSGWLATATVGGSFIVAVLVYVGLADRPASARGPVGGDEPFTQTLWSWIPIGDFNVDIGFMVDPLAMDLVLFVTFVGALIHMFAVGYMRGDSDFPKFFLYLNLFVFSMLVLVLGDNMLLTFLGWEGVGACSFLLISFWFSDEANATAGKKAFITNRIGDWGFMVAMFVVFLTFGTLTYSEFLPVAGGLTETTATAITLLLLVGAVGKSAQLPLYLWLPDAMAGPTPVSALIHAATMVTSGVFLLTRMNPILDVSAAWSLDLIAWVGAITALFAATVAVAQNDIKKVLAYSTVSQLGYLFMAVGTGSYVAGIFHMTTHASFKALLFLGAGSVIHGMHHDQDMRHYGALRRLLPLTAFTFIIGWLAIAGVPPFSGFWSKDEVLLGAWDAGGTSGTLLWVVGIVTALLTAFYMTRQVMMTFFGRYRYADARPAEIDAAWAAEVEAARSGADEAEAVATEAASAVDEAKSSFQGSVSAFAEAETALAEADDEGREAAQAAVETAAAARKSAREAVPDARTAAADARAAAEQAAVLRNRVEAADAERPEPVYDLYEAPDLAMIEERLPDAVAERREYVPHESPWTMTVPLLVLAGTTIFAGILNLPFDVTGHWLEDWLAPSLAHEHVVGTSDTGKVVLALIAIAASALGVALGYLVYLRHKLSIRRIEQPVLANAWYYDKSITGFMGGPGRRLFDAVTWFDTNIIDGAVNGAGRLVRLVGGPMRSLQTGLVRTYAAAVTLGAVLVVLWFVLRGLS
ncbi:MAG: NADH-quinone oxidoreductase subunit L [Acidimicrobiales bacterium]